MIRVTANSFPACVSVPMAVASIVSGFDLSWQKAEGVPRLSRQVSSKLPMASLRLLGPKFLICDILFLLQVRSSLAFIFRFDHRLSCSIRNFHHRLPPADNVLLAAAECNCRSR